jgi:hypothetical protein
MTKNPHEQDPLFSGLRVPGPPDGLRRQVLDRATQALGQEPAHDRWARLWESRPARLAWAASILALAVGHLLLPAGASQGARLAQGAPPASAPATAVRTDAGQDDELSVIADLPKLSLEGRPMAAPADLDATSPTAQSEENAS